MLLSFIIEDFNAMLPPPPPDVTKLALRPPIVHVDVADNEWIFTCQTECRTCR